MIIGPQPTTKTAILGIRIVIDRQMTRIADSRGVWPFKRIAVGLRWFALPDKERSAVLYHEAGHCKLFHLEKRILMLIGLFVRPALVREWAQAQELEADEFAAKHGYGVELLRVIERFRGESDGMFYPSFEERAQRLRRFT